MPFPTNLFVSGHANNVEWQQIGGNNKALIVKSSSWDEEINAIDVTHSGSGGGQCLLANVIRGSGTVQADYDIQEPPYLTPPNITPGVSGQLVFYIAKPQGSPYLSGNVTRFFSIPAMIIKVHWETQVAGGVSYSFDIRLNALVGNYIRPIA